MDDAQLPPLVMNPLPRGKRLKPGASSSTVCLAEQGKCCYLARHGNWRGTPDQLLRGALDLCLLAVMEEGPAYGYEMTKRLRARGLSTVGEGSIYPLLGRLEREGLVETLSRREQRRPAAQVLPPFPRRAPCARGGSGRVARGAGRARCRARSRRSGGGCMNPFVEECRREWKRLGVPDPVANEMAADLEVDLAEAEADGTSAEEVLGTGVFDAPAFAAAGPQSGESSRRPTPSRPKPRAGGPRAPFRDRGLRARRDRRRRCWCSFRSRRSRRAWPLGAPVPARPAPWRIRRRLRIIQQGRFISSCRRCRRAIIVPPLPAPRCPGGRLGTPTTSAPPAASSASCCCSSVSPGRC